MQRNGNWTCADCKDTHKNNNYQRSDVNVYERTDKQVLLDSKNKAVYTSRSRVRMGRGSNPQTARKRRKKLSITDGRTNQIRGSGDGEGNQRGKKEKKGKFGENRTFYSTKS